MLRSAIFIVAGNCHTVHFVVAAAVVMAFVAAFFFVTALVAVMMTVVDIVKIERYMRAYMPCAVAVMDVNAYRRHHIKEQCHHSSDTDKHWTFHIGCEIKNFLITTTLMYTR